LSAPPGLAPVTLSDRALEVVRRRRRKAQSWYFDVNLLASYWGQERVYHHTAPVAMNYALHEALRLVLWEGLPQRWRRHRDNHELLRQGLAELGLEIVSQAGHQLWQLNAVGVPAGVDEAGIRRRLLEDHQIEIGAGLGPFKGRVWRIGLMGETCRPENVRALLEALRVLLRR
jgi:alanine-glyoxylate transaminase/serine-glyoxylate transaminase/serine-pyruvate transaminase